MSKKALDALQAAHSQREFLTRFNDVVGAAQMTLIALLREGRGDRLPGFARWYEAKRQALAEDELMQIVHDARDYNFNDGPNKLRFVTDQPFLRNDEHGRPARDSAWWAMPAVPGTHVAIDNAPVTHEGQPLERNDPVAFCMEVINSLEGLLAEAEESVG